MAEIETETDIGLVMVIGMSVMARIATEIAMIVTMIKNITETEIIGGHVTETMIKIVIVTEDMIEIVTGTTLTRIEQDTVENGIGEEVIQRIITVMKLYTHFLSFCMLFFLEIHRIIYSASMYMKYTQHFQI